MLLYISLLLNCFALPDSPLPQTPVETEHFAECLIERSRAADSTNCTSVMRHTFSAAAALYRSSRFDARALTRCSRGCPQRVAHSSTLASLPLTVAPAGIPELIPARNLPTPTVRISTLSNGLRVATQETYGQVASLALFIDAGSMYERAESIGPFRRLPGSIMGSSERGASLSQHFAHFSDLTAGACHFLETAAFKSTANRTTEDILEYTTRHGIATGAVFNREVLMYKVDCLRGDVEDSLALLSDVVLCPRLSEPELDAARQVIAFQRDEALSQPQVLVSEHLYTAAYGHATPLGRPEKCPDSQIPVMTPDILRAYMRNLYTAPRMVLSAVGVDHETAVAVAERFLAAVPAGSPAESAPVLRPKPAYIGGDVRSSPDWSSLPPTVAAATAKTEFTHMMLAFPTVGWSDDDVVPICVVDTLLGGGSSFSAGGPGKGMYSRLYREVLNAFHWVDAANAFSTQLYDSGVVGIYASAVPEEAGQLATIAANQLVRLTHTPVKPAELARARNQLASSVMMNLETRSLLCEDIGRQILSHGKRMDPGELVRRIQAVSTDDIVRVMRSALSQPPSFAVVGEPSASLPSYEQLRGFFGEAAARFR